MIVVPVGYLGYVYWDKHHRGRRRRQRNNNNNNNSEDGQQQQEIPEEPPSFVEFVRSSFHEIIFQQDDDTANTHNNNADTSTPNHTATDIANAMIAELSHVVGGGGGLDCEKINTTKTKLMRVSTLEDTTVDSLRTTITSSLSSSSSSDSSYSSSSKESYRDHATKEDMNNDGINISCRGNAIKEDEYAAIGIITLVDGLEYEIPQEKEEKGEHEDCED